MTARRTKHSLVVFVLRMAEPSSSSPRITRPPEMPRTSTKTGGDGARPFPPPACRTHDSGSCREEESAAETGPLLLSPLPLNLPREEERVSTTPRAHHSCSTRDGGGGRGGRGELTPNPGRARLSLSTPPLPASYAAFFLFFSSVLILFVAAVLPITSACSVAN